MTWDGMPARGLDRPTCVASPNSAIIAGNPPKQWVMFHKIS